MISLYVDKILFYIFYILGFGFWLDLFYIFFYGLLLLFSFSFLMLFSGGNEY